MTKKEFIQYWVDSAQKDWQASEVLYKGKSYVHALFFAHLTLEKLSKAHWVKNHISNHPPRIHNLIFIIDKTILKPNDEQRAFLEKINAFQLEGRYPDYNNMIYRTSDKVFTHSTLQQANTIKEWLLINL
jgi:AbiV family abortive infection protein